MDFDQIAAHFNKPIKVAARDLATCTTNLKKVCRSLGIARWPYRKIRSLDTKMEVLRKSGHGPHFQGDIDDIRKRKEMILNGAYLSDSSKESKTKKRKHDIESSSDSDDSYDPSAKRTTPETRGTSIVKPSSQVQFPGELSFSLNASSQQAVRPAPATAPTLPIPTTIPTIFNPIYSFYMNPSIPNVHASAITIPPRVPQPPTVVMPTTLPYEDELLMPFVPVPDQQSFLFDDVFLTQLASQG